MIAKKQRFLDDYEKCGKVTYMIVIIKLPTDALEMIVNTENIEDKMAYYLSSYDDQLHLIANPLVRIDKWLFV